MIINFSDIRQAIKENKDILIKKGSASSIKIIDIFSALGNCDCSRLRVKNHGRIYQMIGGSGYIGNVKVSLSSKIKKDFKLVKR